MGLDNFETLVDAESLSLRDSELSEALNALLGTQRHAVKAVITTRIAPRDLAISEPGRQHHLSLDEGLESPYAENVLREMDADRRVGLKSAPDALLKVAREKTRGYPRALEALYAILSVDRYTTLEELLEISLHGIIALRQGERETAQEAFTKSIAQADEILAKTPDYFDALDAKGLSICGSAVIRDQVSGIRDQERDVAEAIETFKRAREIAPHAGVAKSALRLFDELVKCDEEGVLKGVRKVISG
jgi:tetratricopeptide (TPR) repeat protein